MNTKLVSACIVLLMIFTIISYNSAKAETLANLETNEAVTPQKDDMANNPAGKISSGYTDFGFKVYSELLKEDKDKNIFISPSSIAFALSMTYNGAEGTTKEAMAEVLNMNGLTLEEINKANQALMEALEKDEEKVELSIANSLWANPAIEFKESFMERCKKYYDAEVSNEFTKEAINGWIEEKTNEKIKDVIDEVPPDAILYLVNAIYFKGTWTVEFDKEKTKELDFHLLDGSKKKHPMMITSNTFNYCKGEKFQAVSLPYGDGKYSMYVFLPDENSNLEEFQENLTGENWEKWMKSFHATEGDLVLPRFKVEYKVLLNDALQAMGMDVAFGSGANFSGMTDMASKISKAIHQTFVEVNEEGTEAAAVTVIEMTRTTSAEPPQRFQMSVNRPFFFSIRDNESGTILFMGSVIEPKE